MSRRAPSDNREVDPRVSGWMLRAIELMADTQPHPNPRVGAVVLDPTGGEISAAAHEGPGSPHAEVLALRAAGDASRGATVVTTLEPCSHHGLTPPCVDALVAGGVARVIVGAVDPDERVAGSGIAALRAAGVDVIVGVAADEVVASDPGYFHHRRAGRPRFRLKMAATLDGQVAAADGTSQWITSEAARLDAHRLRAAADAIIVGAGTLRSDDPQLTARHPSFSGDQPRPVVIGGGIPLPASRRIYARNPLVFVPREVTPIPGCEMVVVGSENGRVDLLRAAKELSMRGYLEILVDGGPTLTQAFAEAGLADHLTLYLGAKLAGGRGISMFPGPFVTLSDANPMEIVGVAKVGPDIRIDARPQEGDA